MSFDGVRPDHRRFDGARRRIVSRLPRRRWDEQKNPVNNRPASYDCRSIGGRSVEALRKDDRTNRTDEDERSCFMEIYRDRDERPKKPFASPVCSGSSRRERPANNNGMGVGRTSADANPRQILKFVSAAMAGEERLSSDGELGEFDLAFEFIVVYS